MSRLTPIIYTYVRMFKHDKLIYLTRASSSICSREQKWNGKMKHWRPLWTFESCSDLFKKVIHTNFTPVKRIDPARCAVVHQHISRPAMETNDTVRKLATSVALFSSDLCVRDLVCLLVFECLSDLACLWEPEYQAAAKVVFMTTSTGTRSATALFEALIVRRIPFPACTTKKKRQLLTSSTKKH